MEKFTKKGLNELKKEKEFNTKVERRIINDIINTGLTTSELKNYIKTILKYDEIYRLMTIILCKCSDMINAGKE